MVTAGRVDMDPPLGKAVRAGVAGKGYRQRSPQNCVDQDRRLAGLSLGIQSVITRTVTVAAGRFAPGHLGES